MKNRVARAAVLASIVASWSVASAQVAVGLTVDFEDGLVAGWAEGPVSPNPPGVIASGGPSGAGDAFLQNVSTGGGSAGGAQLIQNGTTFAGDYLAAGVTEIRVDIRADPSSGPVFMRVAFQGATGGGYASAEAAFVPNDGVWRTYTFAVSETALAQAVDASPRPFEDVLSNVSRVRILQSESAPFYTPPRLRAHRGRRRV